MWSGADGVYTFKYIVDDSAPYHMESVLGLLDLNLPTDEGVYVPRDQQAGWKFDEALKLITPAADSAPHRKRAAGRGVPPTTRLAAPLARRSAP